MITCEIGAWDDRVHPLGATRTFRIRHRARGWRTWNLRIETSSSLMRSGTPTTGTIPSEKGAGYRCNLTFRCVSPLSVPPKLFAVSRQELPGILQEHRIRRSSRSSDWRRRAEALGLGREPQVETAEDVAASGAREKAPLPWRISLSAAGRPRFEESGRSCAQ